MQHGRSTISETPLAGKLHRSLRLSVPDLDLNVDRWPADIRLNRFKSGEDDVVRLFSARTVRDIDALRERYESEPITPKRPEKQAETSMSKALVRDS